MKIKEAIDLLQDVYEKYGNVEFYVENTENESADETRELYLIGKIDEETLEKKNVNGVYFINYVEQFEKNK